METTLCPCKVLNRATGGIEITEVILVRLKKYCKESLYQPNFLWKLISQLDSFNWGWVISPHLEVYWSQKLNKKLLFFQLLEIKYVRCFRSFDNIFFLLFSFSGIKFNRMNNPNSFQFYFLCFLNWKITEQLGKREMKLFWVQRR